AGSCTTVFPDTYGTKFKDAITWMRGAGLTDGVQSGGTRYYQQSAQLSREAMAAFLHRQAGSPKPRRARSAPLPRLTGSGASRARSGTAEAAAGASRSTTRR
ncbi:MAG: hypothetical protein ACK5MR_07995, partial [Cumulibacter sp.]